MRKKHAKKDYSNVVYFLLGLFICSVFILTGKIEHNYSLTGSIIKTCNNAVVVVDSAGEQWYYNTSKEFKKGDKVKIYFFDNCTATNRLDDEVKKIK